VFGAFIGDVDRPQAGEHAGSRVAHGFAWACRDFAGIDHADVSSFMAADAAAAYSIEPDEGRLCHQAAGRVRASISSRVELTISGDSYAAQWPVFGISRISASGLRSRRALTRSGPFGLAGASSSPHMPFSGDCNWSMAVRIAPLREMAGVFNRERMVFQSWIAIARSSILAVSAIISRFRLI